jgi:hypothetical protein
MTWRVPSGEGRPVIRIALTFLQGHAHTLQQLQSLFSGLRAPAAGL